MVQKSLDVVLGTVNTVILIFSSLTVAVAVKAIQENRIKLVKINAVDYYNLRSNFRGE